MGRGSKVARMYNSHLINILKDSKDASSRQAGVPFKVRPEHVNLFTNYA